MNLTQNIDNLEDKAGIDPKKVCLANGCIKDAACSKCKNPMDPKELMEYVKKSEIYRCSDEKCKGPVKPQIKLSGEPLPSDFFKKAK